MRRLAISSWTLHGQLQNGLALLDLPAQIAQRGIHALEICHFHLPSTAPAYLAELKAACQAAEVEAYSILIDTGDITAPDPQQRTTDLQTIRSWIDIAAELGAGRIRIVAGMQPPTQEVIQHSVDNLRDLVEYAEQRGVKAITENWHATGLDPQALVSILDQCEGRLGLCADCPLGDESAERKIFPASTQRRSVGGARTHRAERRLRPRGRRPNYCGKRRR